MLGLALDVIVHGAPDSVLAFCLCNLIIAMLVFSSKTCPGSAQPNQHYRRSKAVLEMSASNVSCCSNGEKDRDLEMNGASEEDQNGERSDHEEDEGEVVGGSEDVEEEENDKLRRKAEEFIAKVNKQWRAEMHGLLQTSGHFTADGLSS